MQRFAVAFVLGCVLMSAVARSAEKTPSVASAAVQSAIVAAVERDRKAYGGRTPIPAVLIGV